MAYTNLPPGIDPTKIPSSLPPPGEISNFQDPVTLTSTAIAVSSTTLALALILLCLRLFSTIFVTHSVGKDDFTAVIAYLFAVGFAYLILNLTAFARLSWDFETALFTTTLAKTTFATQITLAMASFFSKVSILLLLFKVFSQNTTFRYANYLGILWAGLIAITTIVLDLAYCMPRVGESFSSVSSISRCHGTRIEGAIVVRGAFIMALDFYIFLLPLPLLWRLQLATKKKAAITFVFMTGLM